MITEAAPAKLNLGLAVTARRGDGYHELDTIFALLTLSDELEAVQTDGGFSLELVPEGGLPGRHLLQVEGNLVLQAAELFRQETGTLPGVHFRLLKRIPLAAGLGGGSADAAAALRALARLYPEAAATADLPSLARKLGSDVPFLYSGDNAAHGRGRGERLQAVGLPQRHVVLANPGVAVTAEKAYSWLQNFSRRQPVQRVIDALAQHQEPRWQNALQAGVVREVREMRDVLTELRAEELQGVLMSGSGTTGFGLAYDRPAAERAAAAISARRPGWWVSVDSIGTQAA